MGLDTAAGIPINHSHVNRKEHSNQKELNLLLNKLEAID